MSRGQDWNVYALRIRPKMQSAHTHLLPTLNTPPNRGCIAPQSSHDVTLDSKFSVRNTKNTDSMFILGLVTCNCIQFLRPILRFRLIGPIEINPCSVYNRYAFLVESIRRRVN
jgi:hypothetical protein